MAEANRDEASRCYRLSRKFFAENEHELALKYAEKSVRLFSTSDHETWLANVRTLSTSSQGPSKQPQDKTNEYTPLNNENTQKKTVNNGKENVNNSRNYNKEQVEQVKAFLRINKEDYYKVLGVQRESSDVEIKKSYRKLALQFHPDKNNAPGADEAFKIVSRAFSCLSDPQKRAGYDRFGGETATATSSAPYQSPFGDEINPEELFNMFFGSPNGFGGPGGIQFQFHTGPSPFGNIFMNNFAAAAAAAAASNGYRQRRRQAEEVPTSLVALIIQFVPMIILAIILFFLNRVQSTSAAHSSSPSWETLSRHCSLHKNVDYPVGPYHTPSFNIEFYITDQLANYWRNRENEDEWRKVEILFEQEYISELQRKCKVEEMELRREREQAAKYNNKIRLEELNSQKGVSCELLYSLGAHT